MHHQKKKKKFATFLAFILRKFLPRRALFLYLSFVSHPPTFYVESDYRRRQIHNEELFPFSVDDKESNSSSGGDGKTKSSSTAASTSNNSSAKIVNSNFNDGTTSDKVNSTIKATSLPSSSAAAAPNSDQAVTNSAESVSEQAKCSPATKANNCDAISDVINNAIDTSGIKVEIKDDPDAPKNKSVNNIQPALGGSLLPSHAANAKHPVSIAEIVLLFFLFLFSFRVSCIGESRKTSLERFIIQRGRRMPGDLPARMFE